MGLNQHTITGHSHILHPFGKGDMGEVYLAEATRVKREVAIKVLPESVNKDPERLKRFRREAEAAAKLKHLNIPNIYRIEKAFGQTHNTFAKMSCSMRYHILPCR